MELQHSEILKAFRMVNGVECVFIDLKKFIKLKAIIYDFTWSYFPEYNRVAEHPNYTVWEVLTAWYVSASTSNKKLCTETVLTSKSTKYCHSHKAPMHLPPLVALYGLKLSIVHIQPFGKECYLHEPYLTEWAESNWVTGHIGLFLLDIPIQLINKEFCYLIQNRL
jgi:hypothetical protein